MPNYVYPAIGLIGGTAGFLDAIDGTNLADKDMAYVTVGGKTYTYILDADSAAAESSPDIIQPDANGGDKRWILQSIYGNITFSATQVASADANTLDDYEEGTWTPVDASGAELSFTGVNAHYTKIGRLVFFFAQLTYPTTADANPAVIGGLPFTVANVLGIRGGGNVGFCDETTVKYLLVNMNTTNMSLLIDTSGPISNAGMSENTIIFSGIYHV